MGLRFNIVFIFLCLWLLKMLNKIIAIIKLLKLFYLMYNITTASTKSNTHDIIMSVIKYTSTGSSLRNLKHAWYNYICYKVPFTKSQFLRSQWIFSLLCRFCFFPLPPTRLLPDVTISETRRAKQFCLPPICW